MIALIFFIYDPFYVILLCFTSFILTETQLCVTSSHTSSSFNFITISLQSSYKSKLAILAIFYSVGAFIAFSLIAFDTALFALFSCFYTCFYSSQYYSDISTCLIFSSLMLSPHLFFIPPCISFTPPLLFPNTL